ncbi:RAMP superfamily CRISPR-associated protein [Pseudothermotoga sp. U03pept]|uniref:RAMP superfamily CRISPR-associated protein n=1 Tax=Pseudothermotoga sp. U03pept TaxID=3447012 RepID=UPI003F0BB274
MSWNLYSLTFRLESPLHIGYPKILHLVRTRLYVPARSVWGALTVRLVQCTRTSDYKKAGNFLKLHFRFGYLYLSADEKLYIPQYTTDGLKYGECSRYEFEKKFIFSMTTTAISASSICADEETLHHIEYVNPYTMDGGSPVFLKGLIWVESVDGNFHPEENDFSLEYEGISLRLSKLLEFLQVGGERKYGFGRMKLESSKLRLVSESDLASEGFPGSWRAQNGLVLVEIHRGESVWAHVEYDPNLKMNGEIEVYTGRDWDAKKGAGRNIASYGISWLPGSVMETDTTFELKASGVWCYKQRIDN